jgi:hypothetical protein
MAAADDVEERRFVLFPDHCGVLAIYSFAMCSWCCAVCGVMLLTDEFAFRAMPNA